MTAIAVHPRVRGEQPARVYDRYVHYGSSPRARGTGSFWIGGTGKSRFIPACAGNSRRLLQGLWPSPVHTRVRGEQAPESTSSTFQFGSSPRARGTVAEGRQRYHLGRFIPACAGNSVARPSGVQPSTVHPRVRGEQGIPRNVIRFCTGSSPRARGTGPRLLPASGGHRFIPACAGNSMTRVVRKTLDAVHPRVRGEQSTFTNIESSSAGSSPRARGTGSTALSRSPLVRFIPACAGNRSRIRSAATLMAVHPRVRGEQRGQRTRRRAKYGSSPRARGTVRSGICPQLRARFIPACAGNR